MHQLDWLLFHFINDTLSNSVFDAVLPWCREQWIWAPFYVFIVSFALLNWGKKGGWVIVGLICCVGLTDLTSNYAFKKRFKRLRPCNDPVLAETVRLRLPACGGGYSFTSSHAANHFAVAVFLIGFLGPLKRWAKPALLGWATLVAFAQVYVGVHFPFDVLCGALLGTAIGYGIRNRTICAFNSLRD